MVHKESIEGIPFLINRGSYEFRGVIEGTALHDGAFFVVRFEGAATITLEAVYDEHTGKYSWVAHHTHDYSYLISEIGKLIIAYFEIPER